MELSSNTSFPFCQTYTPKKKGIHNHKTGPKVLFGSKPFLPSPDPVKKKKAALFDSSTDGCNENLLG